MSEKIIYPSIDLFLYDIRDSLGQDETKPTQNSQQFFKRLYGNLDEKSFQQKYAQFQRYNNSDADAIELVETKTINFQSPLNGYYYPLQLGDTYGLQVNYSGKGDANGKPNDDEQDLDNKPFLRLKQEIVQHISQQPGTLGQTWLVWGQLTRRSHKSEWNIEKIAQECYAQVVSSGTWEQAIIGKGKLLGGTVFELWYRPETLGLNDKDFWEKFRKENYHVLICLFPYNQSSDDIKKQMQSAYYDLMRLWQYRHKIVWSYYQSRCRRALLKQEYIEIQPTINQVSQLPKKLKENSLDLSILQENLGTNLSKLSDYTIALNILENQSRAIQINQENYKAHLEEMSKRYIDSDLDFLKLFSDHEIYAKKYQRQIEADYATLSPGLTLLQNLNSTTQGMIDLEQSKRERTLKTTIAIAGTGLATSQIASTVLVSQPPERQEPLAFRTQTFFLSLGIGVIAMLLAWFILRLLHQEREQGTGNREQ